jgi:hypothetical protein
MRGSGLTPGLTWLEESDLTDCQGRRKRPHCAFTIKYPGLGLCSPLTNLEKIMVWNLPLRRSFEIILYSRHSCVSLKHI